ncbi:hypothetical protein GM30_09455 [Trabulsiella odontotermitis]|nr:hypothetical protein GM30_09455 [Trabulsiella odontotermitis]
MGYPFNKFRQEMSMVKHPTGDKEAVLPRRAKFSSSLTIFQFKRFIFHFEITITLLNLSK